MEEPKKKRSRKKNTKDNSLPLMLPPPSRDRLDLPMMTIRRISICAGLVHVEEEEEEESDDVIKCCG